MACNDALGKDPLGHTRVSAKATLERDEMVFEFARSHAIPIVMLVGRGYGVTSCRVARHNVIALNEKFDLF